MRLNFGSHEGWASYLHVNWFNSNINRVHPVNERNPCSVISEASDEQTWRTDSLKGERLVAVFTTLRIW